MMLSLEDQILIAIRRISRAIDLRSRGLLQDFGLTAPQLAILSAIGRLQPVTAGRLASEVHLGHPTVTGILNRLEVRGLIERVRGNQDRRSVYVSLTAEGARVLQSAPSLFEERFLKQLGELREWERTQMLATLQRIADMMHVSRVEPVHEMGRALPEVAPGDQPVSAEQSVPFASFPTSPPAASAAGAGTIWGSPIGASAEATELPKPLLPDVLLTEDQDGDSR